MVYNQEKVKNKIIWKEKKYKKQKKSKKDQKQWKNLKWQFICYFRMRCDLTFLIVVVSDWFKSFLIERLSVFVAGYVPSIECYLSI